MQELSLLSQVSLYVLLALMALFALIVWGGQVMILRGKAFKNPDGSVDDWHEQKTHYGIAFADAFLACPASIVGIVLVFVSPRWGYYLLALASFWWVWGNVMTTATSLRFHNPRINLMWFITFPFGALVGLAYPDLARRQPGERREQAMANFFGSSRNSGVNMLEGGESPRILYA